MMNNQAKQGAREEDFRHVSEKNFLVKFWILATFLQVALWLACLMPRSMGGCHEYTAELSSLSDGRRCKTEPKVVQDYWQEEIAFEGKELGG